MTFLLAFALGITAGLRSMTPPAAVAWAAHFGWLSLDGTPLAFLGSPLARWILLAAMISELVADMRNANVGNRAGGALFAGLFLQRFVGRTGEGDDAPRIPWVHLDIAGSSMSTGSAFGFTDKGPTGATVRALIDFVAAGGEVR